MLKVLRKQRLKLLNIKHIRIGDPDYFKSLADPALDGGLRKRLREYTADFDARVIRHTQAMVLEREDDDPSDPYRDVLVQIAGANDTGKLLTYFGGSFYEGTVKEEHEIGVDSASLVLELQAKGGKSVSEVIQTGGDGSMGFVHKYKEYFGFYAWLAFDPMFLPYEEAISLFEPILAS